MPGETVPPLRPAPVDPRHAAQRLGRLAAIEKHLLRAQGARLPALESWSLKQRVVHHLFADAEHAQALLTRRRELPSGTRQIPSLEPELFAGIESCLHLAGDYRFCSALYLGVKPLLVQAYRHYLEETVPTSDQRSRHVIEGIVAEEERQIAWVQDALAMMPDVGGDAPLQAHEDLERIQRWLAAAGGMLGEGERCPGTSPEPSRYAVAQNARREPRQKTTLEFDASDVVSDRRQQLVATQFAAFFREMQATETIAALLWEAPEDMPWEFFADTARHCWDEIRHCQVGQDRLQRLGLDIWSVPAPTRNYDIRARMPLLERYAYLTQVEEAGSFTAKRKHEATFRQEGDQLSADMVAYDIADERRHVAFGTRWLPELQRALGDSRHLSTLIEDATRMRKALARDHRDRLSGSY